MTRLAPLLLVLTAVLCPSLATASDGLTVHRIPPEGLRIDGSIADWRGVRFAKAGQGRDAAFGAALGFDDDGLYIAAEVIDDRLVRTSRPGAVEDALIVTLAVPHRGRYRGVDVWLYAGVAGRSRAVGALARAGRAPVINDAIKVVEGPLREARGSVEGYVIEGFVPFRVLGLGDKWAFGRGAVRLRDVDLEAHPRVESEPATATVSADGLSSLPPLAIEGGIEGLIAGFSAEHGLRGVVPRFSFEGDVAEDEASERVVILGPHVVVVGPRYRGGESYNFFRLPVSRGSDVRAAALVELTGDRKKELVARVRQQNDQGTRYVYLALSLAQEQIAPLFGIELRKEIGEGYVQAHVQVERRSNGAPEIQARIGRSVRLGPETYLESPATDVVPIVLPWGPNAVEKYRWDGSRLVMIGSRPNPKARSAEASPTGRGDSGGHDVAPAAEQPPSYDAADIMAAIRKAHAIPSGTRARFRQRGQLVGDGQPEEALVLGRVLAVFGPGFREGQGYFGYELPVEAPEDVLGVKLADVTADGAGELLIRVRQRLGEVIREVLLVHRFAGDGFPRLAAIEVARSQDRNRISNEVRVAGAGRNARLAVSPGTAKGWSESSWPFADGTGDGVEPLLLPWRDRAVTYELRGGRLVKR